MILGEPFWYWLLFLAAVAVLVGIPLLNWLEDRADERDKAAWDEIHQRRARP